MTKPSTSQSRYEESILRSLRRILRAVALHSRELARQHTLTAPQLICLRELDGRGELSLGELAEAVSLSPATVTGILSRLEARGLVERTRAAEDRRRVTTRLTVEGRKLVRRTPLPLQERFARRLRELPEAERRRYATTLSEIVAMMDASELDAAPLLSEQSEVTTRTSGRRDPRSAEGADSSAR